MKILMLTEFFPSSDAAEITGGVEARCFYVSRHLVDSGHQVRVVALRSDGSVWSDASLGSVWSRLRFLLKAIRIGLSAQFDVVEGTNQTVHPVAWLIGRIRHRPVAYLYADVLLDKWRSDFGRAGWLGLVVERLNLWLKADLYIAISDTVRRKLVRHHIPSERIRVIPCGFEQALVNAVMSEPAIISHDIVVVSRLVRYKRTHIVLDAIATMRRRGVKATAVIVGRGPEEAALREQAKSLGLAPYVQFRGFVRSHKDVLRTIRDARVLVSGSTVEGFGIVVAEAMALGRPFVVPDIEVFREVTDGGAGGALFQADDSDDCATKVLGLLCDSSRYAHASQEAQRLAQRYRWDDISASTADALESVTRS